MNRALWRIGSILAIFAIAFVLEFQCGQAPRIASPGPSSTETVVSLDGNLVNEGGAPVTAAVVYLRPVDYLPNVSAKAAALISLRTIDSTFTDSLGRFSFDSIAAGTYTLECLDGEPGHGALIDSVVIEDPDSTVELATDTLKALGNITGQIQLPESLDASQVRVMIYGLDRIVTPDSIGNYSISGVAEGVYALHFQVIAGLAIDIDSVTVTSGATTRPGKPILTGADRIYAAQTATPMAIDGKFDEADWASAHKISFSKPGSTENMVAVRVLWDSANLYLAYAVEDTSVFVDSLPNIFWFRDAAEIYLDPEHDAADSLAADDLQFILTLRNDLSIHRARQVLADTIARAIDITIDGYNMEMAIPWTLMGKSPATGMAMGVLFGNDDKDGETTLQFDWLDLIGSMKGVVREAWKAPRAWGDLILK